MRRLLFLAGVFATLPQAALAAPTYLTCTVTEEGQASQLSLVVDEDRQTVAVQIPNQAESRAISVKFTPTTVTAIMSASRVAAVGYVIGRTNLLIERITTIGERTWNAAGSCKVEEAPKRAF